MIRLRRTATVTWRGTVTAGGGSIRLGSGAFEGPFSLKARVEESASTNPEELVGAGHAGCFTKSLADSLSESGHPQRT
jgi:osmotically inducible protein OsmC